MLIRLSTEERRSFEAILGLLETEISENKIGHRTVSYSALSIILITIFRKMSISYSSTQNDMKDVLEYINQRYTESITETGLATMCHYNPSYFSRLFKAYTGMTFTDYLKKKRIEAACDMLLTSENKINNIYTKVGYTDKTKFYKHFRQLTGYTPLEYKKVKIEHSLK